MYVKYSLTRDSGFGPQETTSLLTDFKLPHLCHRDLNYRLQVQVTLRLTVGHSLSLP
jgi:hypothetical protein